MNRPINAFYYRQNSNFGDVLTPYLIKNLFGIDIHHCTYPRNCNFIGVGSVLEKLEEAPEDVTIWGAGFMYEESRFSLTKQNILAVRGKLSASHLIGLSKKEGPGSNFPCAIGDPGLLINRTDKALPKRYKIGFIPHYIDRSNENSKYIRSLEGIHYIDIMQEPSSFIKDISQCEYVISSSLHGIVAADAFEIPNLHVLLSPKVFGLNYKFRDYYSAFDQDHKFVDLQSLQPREISVRRLLNSIQDNYQKKPNMQELEDGLIKSFEEWKK